MELAVSMINSWVGNRTVILTADSGSLNWCCSSLFCSYLPIYRYVYTCCSSTALRKGIWNSGSRMLRSLAETEICAERDLWFSERKEVLAQYLQKMLSFGMICAEGTMSVQFGWGYTVWWTKITLLFLAVPVSQVADVSNTRASSLAVSRSHQ